MAVGKIMTFGAITLTGVSLFKIDRDLLGGPNMTEKQLIDKALELYNKQNPNDRALMMQIM